MPNGWRISFESSRVFLNPGAGGSFTSVTAAPGASPNPPAGSFTVVTGLFPRLRNDAIGNPPIAAGASAPAVIEFIARIKGGTFISLGTLNGTVDFNAGKGKPLPRFTIKTRTTKQTVNGVVNTTTVIDFTRATTANVTRSDWLLTVNPDADTFPFAAGTSLTDFDIQLPWVFDQKSPILELSARLTVNGAVAADESRNTAFQIPLIHNGVPEDLDPAKPALTLYGLRTALPASLERPGIALGGRPLQVFVHPSVTTFLTTASSAAALAQMRTSILATLSDVGFPTVNVVMSGDPTFAAELARFNGFFTTTNSQFHARGMTNLLGPSPVAVGTKAFLPDRSSTVRGEGALIPFFDCFVALENRNPTKLEIGLGETFNVAGANPIPAGMKLICAPILVMAGSGSKSGMGGQLAKVDSQDHGNLMANVICHEVGHTLGLRHGLSFTGTPPYVDHDQGVPNSVMYITDLTQPPGGASTAAARARTNFFGPVQRNALRSSYQVP
jgi:Met-zincin